MNEKLRLKEDIFVSRYSGNSYILQFADRQWLISNKMYKIIQCIKLYGIYNESQYGMQFSLTEFYNAVDFLKQNNCLVGYDNIINEKKLNRSLFMWSKKKIVTSEKLKKLKKIEFLFYSPLLKISGIFLIIMLLLSIGNLLDMYENISLIVSEKWLLIVAYFLLGTFIHELGHVVACLHANICPKEVGFVIYIIYPSFYTDVSVSWGAKRNDRLKIDLGGIYFQIIYNCLGFLLSYILNSSVLRLACVLETIAIFTVLNPFTKMDGYWFLTDLLEVVNLHKNIRKYIGIFKSNKIGPKEKEELIRNMDLKGWKLYVFNCYVVLSVIYIIFLCFTIIYMYQKAIRYICVTGYIELGGLLSYDGIISIFYVVTITVVIVKIIWASKGGKTY